MAPTGSVAPRVWGPCSRALGTCFRCSPPWPRWSPSSRRSAAAAAAGRRRPCSAGQGESCTRTADCASGLVCIADSVRRPGARRARSHRRRAWSSSSATPAAAAAAAGGAGRRGCPGSRAAAPAERPRRVVLRRRATARRASSAFPRPPGVGGTLRPRVVRPQAHGKDLQRRVRHGRRLLRAAAGQRRSGNARSRPARTSSRCCSRATRPSARRRSPARTSALGCFVYTTYCSTCATSNVWSCTAEPVRLQRAVPEQRHRARWLPGARRGPDGRSRRSATRRRASARRPRAGSATPAPTATGRAPPDGAGTCRGRRLHLLPGRLLLQLRVRRSTARRGTAATPTSKLCTPERDVLVGRPVRVSDRGREREVRQRRTASSPARRTTSAAAPASSRSGERRRQLRGQGVRQRRLLRRTSAARATPTARSSLTT